MWAIKGEGEGKSVADENNYYAFRKEVSFSFWLDNAGSQFIISVPARYFLPHFETCSHLHAIKCRFNKSEMRERLIQMGVVMIGVGAIMIVLV